MRERVGKEVLRAGGEWIREGADRVDLEDLPIPGVGARKGEEDAEHK